MSSTGIKLDDEIKKRIKILAGKADRTPHYIMKTAIEQYVSEQERYWIEREEDEREWNNYQLTGEAVPHDRVKQWLRTVGTENEIECPK